MGRRRKVGRSLNEARLSLQHLSDARRGDATLGRDNRELNLRVITTTAPLLRTIDGRHEWEKREFS